jgi:hypothetical protein
MRAQENFGVIVCYDEVWERLVWKFYLKWKWLLTITRKISLNCLVYLNTTPELAVEGLGIFCLEYEDGAKKSQQCYDQHARQIDESQEIL